jgi:hypothetical protein
LIQLFARSGFPFAPLREKPVSRWWREVKTEASKELSYQIS